MNASAVDPLHPDPSQEDGNGSPGNGYPGTVIARNPHHSLLSLISFTE